MEAYTHILAVISGLVILIVLGLIWATARTHWILLIDASESTSQDPDSASPEESDDSFDVESGDGFDFGGFFDGFPFFD